MPVIEVQPLVLKDVILTIGEAGSDYRKHADGVTFTPASAQQTWTGLGLNTHTDSSAATWTAVISYVQDWDSADSLSRYFYENEGKTVPMTFQPKSGSGASFTANVSITAGAIGGAVNTFGTTSVTLGSDKPALTPAG